MVDLGRVAEIKGQGQSANSKLRDPLSEGLQLGARIGYQSQAGSDLRQRLGDVPSQASRSSRDEHCFAG